MSTPSRRAVEANGATAPEAPIAVLGAVAVRDGSGRLVPLGGQPGRLLAALVAADGVTATVDHLVRALWPDVEPSSWASSLRNHVSRLRRVLEVVGVTVTRDHAGYRLTGDVDTDLGRFERSLAVGRSLLQDGRPDRAAPELHRAVELCAGPAFSPFDGEPFLRSAADHVAAMRLDAQDLCARAVVASETEPDLTWLRGLVEAEPHREQRWAALVTALYRAGRQGDALAAVVEARTGLAEGLGLEPGPELRRLERAVLDQDPRLLPVGATLDADDPTLVGRADSVDEIARALEHRPIVVVTGVAGVGKTACALAAATAVREGYETVRVVDLGEIDDETQVLPRIADALAVRADDDAPGGLAAAVAAHLAERHVLLVADNCEHVADEVGRVLSRVSTPGGRGRVLATSRRPLPVADGALVRVHPLDVPGDEDGEREILAAPAVRLLVARSRSSLLSSTPEALGRLARRLDGLPLALVLASSWLDVVGGDELVELLDEAPAVLDRPPGHGDGTALRDVLDRSVIALGAVGARLHAALATFVGPVGAASLGAVAALDRTEVAHGLGELVAAGLVLPVQTDRDVRYHAPFVVREDALARIGPDERARLRTRHARHVADVVDGEWRRVHSPDQLVALASIDGVIADARAALRWAIDERLVDEAFRIGCALWSYYPYRVSNHEPIRWFDELVPLARAHPDHPLAGRVLALGASVTSTFTGIAAGIPLAEEGMSLSRRHDDEVGVLTAAMALGIGLAWSGRSLERAGAMLAEARAAALAVGLEDDAAAARSFQGLLHVRAGDPQAAVPILEEAVAERRRIGSPGGLGHSLVYLGYGCLFSGDLDRARAALAEGTRHCRRAGNRLTGLHGMLGLVNAELEVGRIEAAGEILIDLLDEFRDAGDAGCEAVCRRLQAEVELAGGRTTGAARLALDALRTSRRLGHDNDVAACLVLLARFALATDEAQLSAALVGAARSVEGAGGIPLGARDRAAAADVERTLVGAPCPDGPAGSDRDLDRVIADVELLVAGRGDVDGV